MAADSSTDLIRRLAHNDKPVRDRAVRAVSEWLAKRKEVGEMDMLKIWKGVFYCTLLCLTPPEQTTWS
jgi:ribosomal RNA-processing protein 1